MKSLALAIPQVERAEYRFHSPIRKRDPTWREVSKKISSNLGEFTFQTFREMKEGMIREAVQKNGRSKRRVTSLPLKCRAHLNFRGYRPLVQPQEGDSVQEKK